MAKKSKFLEDDQEGDDVQKTEQEGSEIQKNEQGFEVGQQDHVKIVYPVPGATDPNTVVPTPETNQEDVQDENPDE